MNTVDCFTPLLDQGYDWISGQSSLLCDRSNVVTMAAGISGDGLWRVRGSCPGLRNNKKKAVTVTFELRVIGLAQKFEAGGVRKWARVTHNPGGQRILRRSWQDLQRTHSGYGNVKTSVTNTKVWGHVKNCVKKICEPIWINYHCSLCRFLSNIGLVVLVFAFHCQYLRVNDKQCWLTDVQISIHLSK